MTNTGIEPDKVVAFPATLPALGSFDTASDKPDELSSDASLKSYLFSRHTAKFSAAAKVTQRR